MPTDAVLAKLCKGVSLKDGPTLPAKARLLEPGPTLPPRDPPIRHRAAIPTAGLSLTLSKGCSQRARRMTAEMGFPTLRLVRLRMENLLLGDSLSR